MTEKEVTHEQALEALGKSPKKKKKKERYKSQDGFVSVPVLRGFTEIQNLYPIVYENEGVILGGYVRYMCSPSQSPVPATDIDIYSPSEEVFHKLVAVFKDNDLEQKRQNDLAILYKPIKKDHHLFPSPTVNLVKPMTEGVVVTEGEMENILANFDFTVVRIGLTAPYIALADADFLHDEEKKILRIKNIHCPISSTYRVMKYNRKGYWPPTETITRLFLDWDNRDDDYKSQVYGFFDRINAGEDLTQEEIDEMERLLRVFD